MTTPEEDERKYRNLWIPDNPDGSGWASVNWVSAVKGSKYHYRHSEALPDANQLRPRFYRIVTRLETEKIVIPHENSYYVAAEDLSDFIAELVWSGGAETIWHIEAIDAPPPEAGIDPLDP